MDSQAFQKTSAVNCGLKTEQLGASVDVAALNVRVAGYGERDGRRQESSAAYLSVPIPNTSA